MLPPTASHGSSLARLPNAPAANPRSSTLPRTGPCRTRPRPRLPQATPPSESKDPRHATATGRSHPIAGAEETAQGCVTDVSWMRRNGEFRPGPTPPWWRPPPAHVLRTLRVARPEWFRSRHRHRRLPCRSGCHQRPEMPPIGRGLRIHPWNVPTSSCPKQTVPPIIRIGQGGASPCPHGTSQGRPGALGSPPDTKGCE